MPVDPTTELEERWSSKVAEAAAKTKQEQPDSGAYNREWDTWHAYESGVALLRIGSKNPTCSSLEVTERGLAEMAETAASLGKPKKAATFHQMISEVKEARR